MNNDRRAGDCQSDAKEWQVVIRHVVELNTLGFLLDFQRVTKSGLSFDLR